MEKLWEKVFYVVLIFALVLRQLKTEYAALGFSFFVASCIRTGSYQTYIPIPVQLLRPGSANRKLIRYRRQYRDVQRPAVPVLRWNRLRFRKSDRNDPL